MGKTTMTMALLAGMLVACSQQQQGPSKAATLNTEEDKTLYALGFSQGQRNASFGLTREEAEKVAAGYLDASSGAQAQIDTQAYSPKIGQFIRSKQEVKSKAEKAKGEEYAAKAAAEPGAQKLPSGLVYKELQPGTGAAPEATDTVKVHYRGTLIDGTEFDSSYSRNQPTEFPLKGVIPCWTEGVQKMKVGGKSKLICPSSIAYGDSGRPPKIPGGATLVFEIELIEVKGK